MDRDGSRLAWMETTTTDTVTADWWVRYYADGHAETVAKSSDLGHGKTLPYVIDDQISLVANTIYWTSTYPAKNGKLDSAAILYKDVGGDHSYHVLAEDAFLHVSNHAGQLDYLVPNGATAAIKSVAPGGSPVIIMPNACIADYYVLALGADATRVAWAVAPKNETDPATPPSTYHSWIYVLSLTDHTLTEIAGYGDGTDAITISKNWMAWGNGSGNGSGQEFVMNLATGAITVLADSYGYSEAAVSYPAVAWRTQPSNSTDPVPLHIGFLTQ